MLGRPCPEYYCSLGIDILRVTAHALDRMTKLILSRLLQAILVLFIVSLLTFALLAAVGGDVLTALGSDPRVSPATIAELGRVYGLDQPFAVRYGRWLSDILLGNFGYSFYFQLPVQNVIWLRLLRTGTMSVTALVIAWTIAFSLGISAARRKNSLLDRLCSVLILLGSSTPRLLLALAVLALAARISWLKIGGATENLNLSEWLLRMLPAALVLSVPLIALFLAQTRAVVVEGLSREIAQTARAKGLPERTILWRHVLRPSLTPLIVVFGYSLGSVMSGSVIVEKVLGWPGLGDLSVIAVQSRDVPLLLGVVLVAATAVLIGNLLADILLRWNDPRLR